MFACKFRCQIYSADGELIAQYGEKRRIPVTLDQIPPEMVKAFIATEDSRFYEHHGVDPVGSSVRQVWRCSRPRVTRASTITQQLARNFFLSPERTLMRKIKEVFLAIRIEQLLTKDEILELYLNKITSVTAPMVSVLRHKSISEKRSTN
ncbi:Penicillin-binding protein 1A [Escherichia coli]|uniref:Penicillin-binding protein 1A n=1 Tax=Escherichia coli TaxID=562 RepID=A0A376TY22_ECOLX|nr:Penicillin-binding protein 1A [Escherichia coli]